MLYPDRQLARFIEKNVIPENLVEESSLLIKLLEDKEKSIIDVDLDGICHFNGTFRNAEVLEQALNSLRYGSYSHLVSDEKDKILAIYERIFDHQSFTGRSGAFYGYEGLGSIYWHMVSKLLLATQECYFRALEENQNPAVIGQLKDHYYEIKAGIGLYKSPELYGAFPMDAYSHTPAGAGVKQPGLTGQVKEDFLSRIAELGIRVNNGMISFNTSLINHEEILAEPAEFEYYTLEGKQQKIVLEPEQMAFTFCQVPVVYTVSGEYKITITYKDNQQAAIPGNTIDRAISAQIFQRSGMVEQIDVSIPDYMTK